jgi:NitT/TauT family transport system ATP-binding protein
VLQDLEVRLPRPRDPDDEALVALSRRIRAMLARGDRLAETPPPIARKEAVDDEAAPRASSVPGGAAPPVGARL